jgi:hypothetical protein
VCMCVYVCVCVCMCVCVFGVCVCVRACKDMHLYVHLRVCLILYKSL